jgi:CP family cyanate transporter-like MFS transporter
VPTLVREWTPHRLGLGSAVLSNGFMVGVTSAPALTIPLVLPLVGQSWRLDFAVWAVPGVVVAMLFFIFGAWSRPSKSATAPTRWWPDWRNPLIWLLLLSAERLQRQTWPYPVFGPLTIVGLAGVVLTDGVWIVLSAAAIGFGLAITFVMIFALPSVLSPAGDVHRMAGGMFAISYSIAVLVPILCGALWDLSGIPWSAFLLLGLCGLALTFLGAALSLRSARH